MLCAILLRLSPSAAGDGDCRPGAVGQGRRPSCARHERRVSRCRRVLVPPRSGESLPLHQSLFRRADARTQRAAAYDPSGRDGHVANDGARERRAERPSPLCQARGDAARRHRDLGHRSQSSCDALQATGRGSPSTRRQYSRALLCHWCRRPVSGRRGSEGHWDAGRTILDFVRPPTPDPDILLWYRAGAAVMMAQGNLAEALPHLRHGLSLFPADARLLFSSGCLYEVLASPRIQRIVQRVQAAGGQVAVENEEGNLERAERFYRRALRRRYHAHGVSHSARARPE